MKQVIFVGGMSGTGKTTICDRLRRKFCCDVQKQVYAIAQIGARYGMKDWREAMVHCEELIDEAIEDVIERFLRAQTDVMLFDTHYCIRADLALRRGCGQRGRFFIHDLDFRWILRMRKDFRLKFILLCCPPALAFQRIQERSADQFNDQDSLEGLEEEARMEECFFNAMIQMLEIPRGTVWKINNQSSLEVVLAECVGIIES